MGKHTISRTRKIILTGFRELLIETEFDKITVQDICERCEIHRSTFYRYYVDKFELLSDLLGIISAEINEKAANTENNTFEILIDYIDDNRKFFAHTLIRNDVLYTELIEIASNLLIKHAERSNDYLTKKINQLPDKKIICDFYSSGMIQVIRKWVGKQYEYSKDELKNMVKELM